MLIRIPRGWELPERIATPESVFLDRRRLLKTAAAGSILMAAPAALIGCDSEEEIAIKSEPDPTAHLYPAKRNEAFKLDRAVTAELVSGLSSDSPRLSQEARRLARLTAREREVASLVSKGLRNLEIADRLHISEVTVRNHLTSIFRKLNVDSRFQLAIYAFNCGLSPVPQRVRAARTVSSPASPRRKKSTG